MAKVFATTLKNKTPSGDEMTQGLFDDAPLINLDRDKAWEAFIKRKDVKRLMQGKENFKFPLDGSYDLWCLCWSKAWDAGFKAGWEAHEELKKVKIKEME